MQLKIEKQDRSQPEKLEVRVHPERVARLKAYAQTMESDMDYIVDQIFDQVLPSARQGPGRPNKDKAGKSAKESLTLQSKGAAA